MAYVSIRWGKSSEHHLKYVLKDRAPDDVTYSRDCTPETAIADFAAVRAEHNQEGGNHVLHVMQSFSPLDSRLRAPSALNALGQSLALSMFPGHQFVIRTHTDTEKTHNHIIVNTVNSETGRKIENKRALIFRLQDASDKLCKENGLSVINREAKERAARLPYKAQQMVRAGKQSYIFDLSQKADVARSIATNFDEYRDTMHAFGIRVLIEEKNISYFYPGRERGKRGSKLGRLYDKPGLIESFQENQGKFAKHPELRTHLQSQVEGVAKHGIPKTPEGLSRFQNHFSGEKGGWRFPEPERIARRQSTAAFQSEQELSRQFVPVSEIAQARTRSIFEYCKQNNLGLIKNAEGKTVLKGKEFVHVTEFEFTNTKNDTRGSLIEFLAAHKGVSLLRAVAQINGNNRLLLLEKYAGEVSLKYKSFHVPKPEQSTARKLARALAPFFQGSRMNPKFRSSFHERTIEQISRQGGVWLFLKDKSQPDSFSSGISVGRHHTERKNRTQDQHHKLQGDSHIFDEMLKTHLQHVHQALFAFGAAMLHQQAQPVDAHTLRAVDIFLTQNPDVKKLNLFTLTPGDRSNEGSRALDFLTKRYAPFGIEVEHVTNERALEKAFELETRNRAPARGKGGLGIGF